MLQGAALLAVVWSSGAVYSWLTNAVPAEDVIPACIVIFTAMAAMFVASLAVPGAFEHCGVLFGTAYLVVQLLQVFLYALATGDTLETHLAILRLAPGFVGAPRLVVTMLCLALIPLAVSVPSLITLGVLAMLLCGLAAFETTTSCEFRRALRAR
jgi:Bacterial low temperature requirement A protein (LtrA)